MQQTFTELLKKKSNKNKIKKSDFKPFNWLY